MPLCEGLADDWTECSECSAKIAEDSLLAHNPLNTLEVSKSVGGMMWLWVKTNGTMLG